MAPSNETVQDGSYAIQRDFVLVTKKDTALSAQMVDYLTNFAKTGDPNGADLPQWQTVTAQQTDFLRLGEEPTHMSSVDVQKLLWTMQNVPAVGE